MATQLAIAYQHGGYNHNSTTSRLLNSIFMTTVNTAAKTLVAVASRTRAEHTERWRPADHMRFMVMLMTWFSVWVLRVLMDHFPCSSIFRSNYLLQGYSSTVGSFDFPPLPSSALTPSSSLDLVLHDGFDGPSVQALGRSITHCGNESDSCRLIDCGKTECAVGRTPSLETFLGLDFCLQPRGDSYTKRSVFDCMLAGSIPVFFWFRTAYDQYEWFLPGEPESYSVFIDRRHVRNGLSIKKVLEQYSREEVRKMREKIFALLNEMPASSRKYQFAVAMADKIVDENSRNGHVELLQINRVALGSAFARTLGLLYRSLKTKQSVNYGGGAWTSTIVRALPLGSYVAPYLKGLGFCVSAIYSTVAGGGQSEKRRRAAADGEDSTAVVAEKYAQELLWITNKLRVCGAVDEAVMQWSLASGLAALSLTANPRVQGSIVKISSILFGELTRGNLDIPSQVKFKLLVLWLPLFCYADNGLAYPVLTGTEKVETERAIDEVISSLPVVDQEVVLTNWLQDFAISPSEWPNLQISYDRWCQSTRKLVP
ncbi:hypothetical protein TEA_017570 [Camellia sinensis var. sinensis]|uniref:Uncharacterized protein n=1 Tax=Camellia sinensis var. sinensis TaxID=542762 RepID=A0A4S4DBS3_CAMSN|nr:hypothetical protein TEA_017570 [Camellia sinensis var. sinensis]